jgi:hypothetical protein
MYLRGSGHQNLKITFPERSPPPKSPEGSKVGICTRGNVPGEFRSPKPEKEFPGESFPTKASRGLKVSIYTRGNVSEEFRSPKPERGAPGGFSPTRVPKTANVDMCTRGMYQKSWGHQPLQKRNAAELLWELWKLTELWKALDWNYIMPHKTIAPEKIQQCISVLRLSNMSWENKSIGVLTFPNSKIGLWSI